MKIADLFLILFSMAVRGFNFAVGKMALSDFPPILVSALRFALVAMLLVPFRRPPPRMLQVAGLAVTLGIFHFPFIFAGLKRLDASTTSVVMQLQVPIGALLASWMLGETLGRRGALGLLLAFGGAMLIAGAPRLGASRYGLLYLLVAASAWAVSNIQLKRIGPVDSFALNGWMGLFASLELFAISWLVEGDPRPAIAHAGWRGWTGVAYMAVFASLVGYGVWMRMIRNYPVNRVMPFMLMIPLFGVLAGVVLQGDRLSVDIALGGLLTICGVALTIFRSPSGGRMTVEAG